MFKLISSLYVIELHPCVFYLSTEAIEKTKPYVHQSETTGLKQEIMKEEGNASVGPAPMDQQQPLQKSELGQCKICILHCLTSFYSCYSHTNMSRWCWERKIHGSKRERENVKSYKNKTVLEHWHGLVYNFGATNTSFSSIFSLTWLTLDHVYIIGTIPDWQGDWVGVFPDQFDDISLLSRGYTTAQHRLTLLCQAHERGPPFWSLIELCLQYNIVQ